MCLVPVGVDLQCSRRVDFHTIWDVYFAISLSAIMGRGFASHSYLLNDSYLQSRLGDIFKLLTFSLSHSVPLFWCVFAPLTALHT